MSQELVFVLSFSAMGIVAFAIIAIAELIYLRRAGWIDQSKTLTYVLGSYFGGLVVYGLFFGVTVGLFLALLASALGGAFLVMLATIVLALVAVAAVPLLMVGWRQLMRNIVGISNEELTWKYSLAMSFISIVFVAAFIGIVLSLLTMISSVTS